MIEPRTRIKGKSRHRYGNLVMSLNRKGGKGGKGGGVRVVDGGYYVCARCGKKLTIGNDYKALCETLYLK